ncbi:glycogen synthase [Cohnella faecalis]|uniref:Glycogen synthase n=1 Tax=Cohnella faecalis TaxID=2315694 RepID=A0A398CPA1_9BACL|nr:glycogen/starch synthase [Cohnella faecalis]RIE03990.1 glycogen synthase [Cohnella faecalis]
MNKTILVATGHIDGAGRNALNLGIVRELADKGLDVRVITPLRRNREPEALAESRELGTIAVPMASDTVEGAVRQSIRNGIPFYWIDAPSYFDEDNVNGHMDDAERYSFFAKAVLESLLLMERLPDIIHCEDWPAAFIPYLKHVSDLENGRKPDRIRTVYTFQSIGSQGIFDIEAAAHLDLDAEALSASGLDYYEQLNFMKAGLLYADALTTVSPTYAREIGTEMGGMTMESIVNARRDRLRGIVGGIDPANWDPENDPELPANYGIGRMEGKRISKARLQEELGLPIRADVPVILYHSELSCERGADLLRYSLADILKSDMQLVVMPAEEGSRGFEEETFAAFFSEAASSKEGKLRFLPYERGRIKRLFAGADIYLMPSASDSGGLEQLIAMRYGTVPIVRSVGGLADTVEPYDADSGKGTGFVFRYANEKVMLHSVREALRLYRDAEAWQVLAENGMGHEYFAARAAAEYAKLYDELADGEFAKALISVGKGE